MGREIKAARVQKGFQELHSVIGAPPPAELNRLRKDDLKVLTDLVSSALERHEAAIAEAEERVSQLAPRPLRGTVRRLLGSSG